VRCPDRDREGAREWVSLAPFCCACRVGGGVALPHPVTLRALIEAFLGNSDCATALLFPQAK